MQFKHISFEEYLDFPYISLAQPGYAGLKIDELRKLADVECEKLLKSDFIVQDYLGNSILRYQLKKTFFSKLANENIIIRSNIYDLINVISHKAKLLPIEIPFEISSVEDIYSSIDIALKNADSHTYYYLIDEWGLDTSRFSAANLVLLSSLESIYGIMGINISWCYIHDDNLYNILVDYFAHSGPSCSHYSEIYAIIAIKNHPLIHSFNNKLLSENAKLMLNFCKKHQELFSYQFSHFRTYCKIFFNINIDIEKIKHNCRLSLNNDKSGALIIHFGQVDFAKDIAKLDEYLGRKENKIL